MWVAHKIEFEERKKLLNTYIYRYFFIRLIKKVSLNAFIFLLSSSFFFYIKIIIILLFIYFINKRNKQTI